MFRIVGDLHGLLRGGSIVRLLGLPERLLVGVQHRIVELLAGLLRAGDKGVQKEHFFTEMLFFVIYFSLPFNIAFKCHFISL